MKSNKSILLTESGIMLSFATLLSMIEIISLPYGGGVTAFSMLPVILIAYRRGAVHGLLTALAFSLLQMLLGLSNLSYATSVIAVVAIIVIDYVFAFTVLGLAGLFRNIKNQTTGLAIGTVVVCFLRYVAHIITGSTVWAGLSIPTTDALFFSIVYNSYMIPETLITLVGAVALSRLLDIRGEQITRAAVREKAPDLAILLSGIAKVILAATAVIDVAMVFTKLQNPKTEEFDVTQIFAVNWPLFLTVTVGAALLALLFFVQAKRVPPDSTVNLKGLFSSLPLVIFAAAAIYDVVIIVQSFLKETLEIEMIIQMVVASALAVGAAVYIIMRMIKKRK
ncbi:MAG TPA: hypothetical protein DEP23_08950 [Ruminococcaceae bacterium]|nr:hypothetical protein [Oscillospiraceae bacterium]